MTLFADWGFELDEALVRHADAITQATSPPPAHTTRSRARASWDKLDAYVVANFERCYGITG